MQKIVVNPTPSIEHLLSDELTILISTPAVDAVTETFIRAHIEKLPCKVHVAYGGFFPIIREDGVPFERHHNLTLHVAQSLKRLVYRKTWEQIRDDPLARWMKEMGVQVLLAEYGQTGAELMGMCEDKRVPLIVHFHGKDAYCEEVLSEYRGKYLKLFENAVALITPCQAMKGQLVSLGASADKIHIVAYGVDTSLFSGSDPSSAPPIFVAVGRFVYKKGPIQTILAFHQLLKQVPDSKLIMVGDGPLLEGCTQLCKHLGISGRVEFRGNQNPTQVAELMRSSRAFVQHSVVSFNNDSEGLPVAILEATSSGLPVISTCHAGIPEAILHEETGYLVQENDVDAMANYMIKLARDPELAAQLGRAGSKRAQVEYSSATSIANLMAVIESVVNPAGQQSNSAHRT